MLGRVNLADVEDPDATELGYRVAERAQGRGVATRAVDEVLRLAAAEGITSVRARTTADNEASRRVLERLHFEQRDEDAENELVTLESGRTARFVHYVWTRDRAGQEETPD